ncbi:MAG: hypothetical protein ACE5HL_12575 [Terriglobia bacterium]
MSAKYLLLFDTEHESGLHSRYSVLCRGTIDLVAQTAYESLRAFHRESQVLLFCGECGKKMGVSFEPMLFRQPSLCCAGCFQRLKAGGRQHTLAEISLAIGPKEWADGRVKDFSKADLEVAYGIESSGRRRKKALTELEKLIKRKKVEESAPRIKEPHVEENGKEEG